MICSDAARRGATALGLRFGSSARFHGNADIRDRLANARPPWQPLQYARRGKQGRLTGNCSPWDVYREDVLSGPLFLPFCIQKCRNFNNLAKSTHPPKGERRSTNLAGRREVQRNRRCQNREASWPAQPWPVEHQPIPRWLWKRLFRLRNRYHSLEDTLQFEGLRGYTRPYTADDAA